MTKSKKKTNGSQLNFKNVVPCFTPGTLIATPKGEREIESLSIGDRILTRDNGIQEISWMGHRSMSATELGDSPNLRPILIRAGSFGSGSPERDMLVSPMHRMLVTSKLAKKYFGEREVLVAARDLTTVPGIDQVKVAGTTYLHFMCEKHQIVLANGTWTESFQPNDYAIKGVVKEQRDELFKICPSLALPDGRRGYKLARKALRRVESLALFK